VRVVRIKNPRSRTIQFIIIRLSAGGAAIEQPGTEIADLPCSAAIVSEKRIAIGITEGPAEGAESAVITRQNAHRSVIEELKSMLDGAQIDVFVAKLPQLVRRKKFSGGQSIQCVKSIAGLECGMTISGEQLHELYRELDIAYSADALLYVDVRLAGVRNSALDSALVLAYAVDYGFFHSRAIDIPADHCEKRVG
jgi:hypothetical protein